MQPGGVDDDDVGRGQGRRVEPAQEEALDAPRRPAARADRDLARGPARLCRALGLTRDDDGVRLGERGARRAFSAMLYLPLLLGAVALVWARETGSASPADGGGHVSPLLTLVIALTVPFLLLPLVRRATAPVRAGARGRDLIGSLRDAGLLELAYGIVFAAATVIITL